MTSAQDTHDKLWELIKDIRYGMLVHRHGDGRLHSHPLTTQNKSLDEGVLYFFVPRDGDIARHVAGDAVVNIAYADPGEDSYVSVAGEASLVDDPGLKQRLFGAMAKAYFPGGAEDPDLTVLRVRIVDAEYWDVDESRMVQLFKMAKAAVTGKPPEMGEHRKVGAM